MSEIKAYISMHQLKAERWNLIRKIVELAELKVGPEEDLVVIFTSKPFPKTVASEQSGYKIL